MQMYRKPRPLNPPEHGTWKVADTTDWRFAAGEMLVPIVLTEIAEVAREYPIIFLKGKSQPYAVLGVEQGSNAYVDASGNWLATYVPARLRAYPFALSPVPDKPEEFAIGIDEEAPQCQSTTGYRLFEDGQPSVYLKQRIELLKRIRTTEPVTAAMVKTLQEAGVLIDRYINVNKPGQESVSLGGMQVVDESKLNALSHEAFAALRDQGVLPLIYAHLLSMANLRQGAIAGKYPQLQQQKQDALSAMLLNDTLKFN